MPMSDFLLSSCVAGKGGSARVFAVRFILRVFHAALAWMFLKSCHIFVCEVDPAVLAKLEEGLGASVAKAAVVHKYLVCGFNVASIHGDIVNGSRVLFCLLRLDARFSYPI